MMRDRIIWVAGPVDDRMSTIVQAQLMFMDNVDKEIRPLLPEDYYVKWGGRFKNIIKAKKQIAITVPIVVFVIFGILYWMFGSAKKALIVFSCVPFAISGGIFFLFLSKNSSILSRVS